MVPFSFGCGSAVFAAIAMLAPSRAARSAIASPMPRLAPEMNSVLPFSVVIGKPPAWVPFREAYSHIARTREVILPIVYGPLLPGSIRAAGSRVGRAARSLLGHGDRIGRALRYWPDHVMAFGAERGQRVLAETA